MAVYFTNIPFTCMLHNILISNRKTTWMREHKRLTDRDKLVSIPTTQDCVNEV